MRSPLTVRRSFKPTESDDEPEFRREESMVVNVARHRLVETIKELAPPGTNHLALAAVAVSDMFCDLVAGLPARTDIIEVCNKQLAQAGLRLAPTSRN